MYGLDTVACCQPQYLLRPDDVGRTQANIGVCPLHKRPTMEDAVYLFGKVLETVAGQSEQRPRKIAQDRADAHRVPCRTQLIELQIPADPRLAVRLRGATHQAEQGGL